MADIFGDEQQPEEALILTPGTEMKELTSLNVARLVDIQGLNAKAIAIRHTAEGMTIKGPVDEANASDFRKGVKAGVQISKAIGLYRQQYCGCIYSEKERFAQPKKRGKEND